MMTDGDDAGERDDQDYNGRQVMMTVGNNANCDEDDNQRWR